MKRIVLAAMAVAALSSACASEEIIRPDAVTVNKANYAYADANFTQATRDYRKSIEESPDSPYRKQALLALADALYKEGNFFEAVLYYERFLELYPLDPLTPRALFYMGMGHYRDAGIPVRDQTESGEALEIFTRFLKLYPDTPFTPYAAKFKGEMEERIAESQIQIARFYFRIGKNVSALGRLQDYLAEYPGSPVEAEAMYMIGACYYREEAYGKAAQVFTFLIDRYPTSEWADKGATLARTLKLKQG